MKLFNVAYSGNSYKVRLLLAQLGRLCEIVEVTKR
jgi:glutathione S-transferase